MPGDKGVLPASGAPPVATLYHLIAVPVAVKFATVGFVFAQKLCGVFTDNKVNAGLNDPVTTPPGAIQFEVDPAKVKLVNVPVLELPLESGNELIPVFVPEAIP